jgi:hypothetical protein
MKVNEKRDGRCGGLRDLERRKIERELNLEKECM